MSYSIRYSNLTKPAITIEDGDVNQQTDLKMIGRGVSGYGEHFAQNFLYLLENFANDTAPSNPIAGQQWYDTVEQLLKVYNGTEWNAVNSNMLNGININVLGTIASQANLPSHPYDGSLGDAYVAIDNGHLYVATFLNPVEWEDFGQFVGYTGSRGLRGYSGSKGEGYTGSKGDTGYTGSAGQDGTSVIIKGTVSTVIELPDPYVGNLGDTFITVNDNHLHVLTETSPTTWTDIGMYSGYTGSRGIQGDVGYTGSVGSVPLDDYMGVGSYVFARHAVGASGVLPDATVSGSELSPGCISAGGYSYPTVVDGAFYATGNATGSAVYTDQTLSGTWRCMGLVANSNSNNYSITLWLRIS